MTRNADIRFVRGETCRVRLTVRDQDGQPVDLTGAALYVTVRPVVAGRSISASPAVIELASPADITIAAQAGGTLGQATATFAAAATATRAPGAYVWDAWVVLGSGDRHAVVEPSRLTLIERSTTIP